jgi:hypothetical protein
MPSDDPGVDSRGMLRKDQPPRLVPVGGEIPLNKTQTGQTLFPQLT